MLVPGQLPSGALVTATGNNLTIIGDATRRTLLSRLDPKCERPELRVFDRHPLEMARGDRGKYLCAALTVLRAFHVAGRPKQAEPLGSFVEWSQWVRGALLWLGQADPVLTMEAARETDQRLAAVVAVIGQWNEVIGSMEVTVKSLIEWATRSMADAFGRPEFIHPDFNDALLTVAGVGGKVNSAKLGTWLRSHKDREIGGRKLITTGTTGGVARWKVESVA